MSKELKITDDLVKEAINKHPEAKEVLETLFPSMKRSALDDKPFIKIGQLFIRRGVNEHNIYCLVKEDGNIRVKNFKHGNMWQDAKLPIFQLKRDTQLTQGEFKELMKNFSTNGGVLKNFVPIPTKLLWDYATRTSFAKDHVDSIHYDATDTRLTFL
jgi:hypothetical protein